MLRYCTSTTCTVHVVQQRAGPPVPGSGAVGKRVGQGVLDKVGAGDQGVGAQIQCMSVLCAAVHVCYAGWRRRAHFPGADTRSTLGAAASTSSAQVELNGDTV
jgi:hypothetical protein